MFLLYVANTQIMFSLRAHHIKGRDANDDKELPVNNDNRKSVLMNTTLFSLQPLHVS